MASYYVSAQMLAPSLLCSTYVAMTLYDITDDLNMQVQRWHVLQVNTQDSRLVHTVATIRSSTISRASYAVVDLGISQGGY